MASLNLIMIAIVNPGKNKIKCTLANMMRTAELDMADSVSPNDIADFLNDTAFAVRSTYHLVLKASPGAGSLAFLADWKKIGNYRQRQTDSCNTERENKTRVNCDYKGFNMELVDGLHPFLRKKTKNRLF